MKKIKYHTIIILSIVLGIIFFLQISVINFDRNTVAINKYSNTQSEYFPDSMIRISGNKYDEINEVFENFHRFNCGFNSLLIIGNSQLHTINDFKRGDHTIPFYLATNSLMGGYKPGCVNGVSLPNINVMEIEFLINTLKRKKIQVGKFIISLEFMGFRSNEVRIELINFFKKPEFNDKNENKKFTLKNDHLLDLFDKQIELFLNENSSYWRLRLDTRSFFIIKIKDLRNFIFNINSQTLRKKIPDKYDGNIQSLLRILDDNSASNFTVYAAPLRPSSTRPYDVDEFSQWLNDLSGLNHRFNFLNLSDLVPVDNWGSNFENDIDFMHFKNEGHKITSNAIMNYIDKSKNLNNSQEIFLFH